MSDAKIRPRDYNGLPKTRKNVWHILLHFSLPHHQASGVEGIRRAWHGRAVNAQAAWIMFYGWRALLWARNMSGKKKAAISAFFLRPVPFLPKKCHFHWKKKQQQSIIPFLFFFPPTSTGKQFLFFSLRHARKTCWDPSSVEYNASSLTRFHERQSCNRDIRGNVHGGSDFGIIHSRWDDIKRSGKFAISGLQMDKVCRGWKACLRQRPPVRPGVADLFSSQFTWDFDPYPPYGIFFSADLHWSQEWPKLLSQGLKIWRPEF